MTHAAMIRCMLSIGTLKNIFNRLCHLSNKDECALQKLGKCLKCVLIILLPIFLLVGIICSPINLAAFKIKPNRLHRQINAFIITCSCTSLRFNVTKENIERVFPNYFHIYCFLSIPLNDSRIHTSPSRVRKKVSSNLLSFITLWTYEIPKYSHNDDLEWSFVFEDDVNFIQPSNFSLSNYINVVEELMQNPEIHLHHGVFYLGICGPTFTNNSRSLLIKHSNKTLLSTKGYGWCAHGMGLTTKRAKNFWIDVSLYRPTPEAAIDFFLREYCIRGKTQYYILGSNVHWPPRSGHYGIAFQDRRRFRSEMN